MGRLEEIFEEGESESESEITIYIREGEGRGSVHEASNLYPMVTKSRSSGWQAKEKSVFLPYPRLLLKLVTRS